ncbi:MAG: FAD-dependent oxidoreductase [Patescibacteria group bacterium]
MEIVVVGAGISGLASAYFLSQKGHRVTVLEQSDVLGGLAASVKEDRWQWPLEGFYHHFFQKDRYLQGLLKDLGLAKDLVYHSAQTSLFCQGQVLPFDTVKDFLSFPHLPFKDKIRMGSAIFLLRQTPFWPIFKNTYAKDVFPKTFGISGWETVWQPLMEGKFGPAWEEVASAWFWARIKSRSSKLGYLLGGTEGLLGKLKDEIKKNGGQIKLNCPIKKLHQTESGWLVVGPKGSFKADRVVLATDFSQALTLSKDYLAPEEVAQWQDLKSLGALTLILRLERKFLPGETYWLNILDPSFPFVAVVEQTNLVDKKIYAGEHVVYVGGYYQQNNPIFTWSQQKVFDRFAPFLRRISPSFDQFLIGSRCFSALNAQPIISPGYQHLVPPLKLTDSGLFCLSTNHIYPWDRGMNQSVVLANKLAQMV